MFVCYKLFGKENVSFLFKSLNFLYDLELFFVVMLWWDGIYFICYLWGIVFIIGIKRLKDLDNVVFLIILEIEMCL